MKPPLYGRSFTPEARSPLEAGLRSSHAFTGQGGQTLRTSARGPRRACATPFAPFMRGAGRVCRPSPIVPTARVQCSMQSDANRRERASHLVKPIAHREARRVDHGTDRETSHATDQVSHRCHHLECRPQPLEGTAPPDDPSATAAGLAASRLLARGRRAGGRPRFADEDAVCGRHLPLLPRHPPERWSTEIKRPYAHVDGARVQEKRAKGDGLSAAGRSQASRGPSAAIAADCAFVERQPRPRRQARHTPVRRPSPSIRQMPRGVAWPRGTTCLGSMRPAPFHGTLRAPPLRNGSCDCPAEALPR
jgi:hypothetical protein